MISNFLSRLVVRRPQQHVGAITLRLQGDFWQQQSMFGGAIMLRPWQIAFCQQPHIYGGTIMLRSLHNELWENAVWFIKRTFQPSIQRRKRKIGYLARKRTVGGRRVLNRRKHKGRARLAG
mmetsp:Transcript_24613/g.36459  ORF Transcript_24613/g.36459 Transcript_24613/m.36459 type:complete len:121 (-) Transcript_24613:150-512(-)